MKKVFAFDFDGVLSESLLEAYLITWRISGAVLPELASSEPRPDLESIQVFRDSHKAHWEHFSALVPFGNRCEDYLVIQSAVHENRRLATQAEFDGYRRRFEPWLEAFHAEFYRERYALTAADQSRWLALNAAYPGIPEALAALSGRFDLAIATSKDGRSVNALLATYGVERFFRPGSLVDKSAGESKRAHLAALRGIFGVEYHDIFFIDDKVSHLIDCDGLGVRCFLAGWGYNGLAERREAAARGFQVLDVPALAAIEP
ncbi:HAD family hydrolase [bacterium]|nr:HAD family hydrolase [bacterium]